MVPADTAGCSSAVAAVVVAVVVAAAGGCTSDQWQVSGCSSDCMLGTDCSCCSNSGCSCPGCTLDCSSGCSPEGEEEYNDIIFSPHFIIYGVLSINESY